MLKLGIVGAGTIARSYITDIKEGKCPGVTVAAVVARSEKRRPWIRENAPEAAIFPDLESLIESKSCEAVLIATPHNAHPQQTIRALHAGLHVLCDKPLGVYARDAREMIAAADMYPELTFGIMYNQRTNCAYRRLREMIRDGELGQLKRIVWQVTDAYRTQRYYDEVDWRGTWAGDGGGLVLNQCPHQLDLLQWLCGMPVRIRAFAHEGKWHDIEVEDDLTAYMEFPGGATGVFVASTGDVPGVNRLEITGTLGRITCENDKLTFQRLEQEERSFCKGCTDPLEKPRWHTEEVATDGLCTYRAGVINAFAEHIANGTPLVADGREGIHALTLSNAILLSSWTGETVELPMDEEKFLALHREKCR